MSYKVKVTDCVNVRQRCVYHTWNYQPRGSPRSKRKNPTSEEMKKVNKAHAVDKLFFKMCRNFTHDDFYVTLKYDGDVNKSVEPWQMKEDIKRFNRLMRSCYRKQGKEYKYIYCFGISENSVRHFHLVVNEIDTKVIEQCWEKSTQHAGRISFEHLWKEFQYRGLAEYFVRNGQQAIDFDGESFKQLYSCSRNLINPVVTVKKVTRSSTFREKPKIDEGFEIVPESVRSGYDCYGFRYFKYLMRRKE
ncbi:MAG: hypothetical protein ACI4W6_04180 [Acutalibacteraceae bacterium]